MMVLDRVKAYLLSLPSRRGLDAVRGYGLLTAALFSLGGALALIYNFIFLPGIHVLPGGAPAATGSATPQEARDITGPINGVFFTATEAKVWQSRRPLAVVIENHVDARPQSGLSSA